MGEWCAEEGLIWTHGFPWSGLPKHEPTIEGVCAAIRELEDGTTYLMVGHPCYDDDEMRPVAAVAKQPGYVGPSRNQQRLGFLDPRVLAAIRERGAALVRYDELPHTGRNEPET